MNGLPFLSEEGSRYGAGRFKASLPATALLLLTVLSLLFVSSGQDSDAEYTGICGDKVMWELAEDGVLTVSGTGPMYDYTEGASPIGPVTDILDIVIRDGVTSVGAWAFSGCINVSSVTIADSVTSIGAGSFADCSKMKSVNIPSAVKSIGTNAFGGLMFGTGSGGVLGYEDLPGYTYAGSGTGFLIQQSSVKVIDSGACGANVRWSLYNNGRLDIYGGGAMYDYPAGGAPWYTYGDQITTVTIANSVQNIGASAFEGCTELVSVQIPSNASTIGDRAFYDCSSLGAVSLANVYNIGAEAFRGCSSLTSVNLNNVMQMGERAFAGSGLQGTVAFGPLGTVPAYAFSDCTGITSFQFNGRMMSIGMGAFSGCTSLTSAELTMPYLNSIGADAFAGCTSLATVILGDQITALNDNTFYGCENLVSVNLPSSLKSIGESAFNLCASLETITFPATLETIAKYAFSDCYSLEAVELPSSVVSIGTEAFAYCTSLERVTVPATTSVGYDAFTPLAFYDGTVSLDCHDLPGFTYTGSGDGKLYRQVTVKVGDRFFFDGFSYEVVSTSMKRVSVIGRTVTTNDVVIPATVGYDGKTFAVTSIGEDAFRGDPAIATVAFGEGLLRIYSGAFADCEKMTSIDMPSSLKTIDSGAFDGTMLTHVSFSSALSTVGADAFDVTFHKSTAALSPTATNLKNKTFEGSGGHLYQIGSIAKNTVLIIDGFTYKVVNMSPQRVSMTGGPSSLVSLNVPSQVSAGGLDFAVTSVAEDAFAGRTDLLYVDLGATTTINEGAFAGCTGLKRVVFSDVLKTIYKDSFDVTFHNGTTTLTESATNLKGKTFEGSGGHLYLVGSIVKNTVFILDGFTYKVVNMDPQRVSLTGGPDGLEVLVVPSTVTVAGATFDVTSVAQHAFEGCTSLKAAILPDVTTIYQYAFAGCTGLEKVAFSSALKTVHASSFDVTFHRGSSVLSETATNFKGKTFDGSGGHLYQAGSISKNNIIYLGDLKFKVVNMDPKRVSLIDGSMDIVDLVVPEHIYAGGSTFDVTSVGEGAFAGHIALKTVDLGAVTTVYKTAFQACDLTKVVFSEGLKTIYSSSFDVEFMAGTKSVSSADDLRGGTFEGEEGFLYLDGLYLGKEFEIDGLVYEVVNIDLLRVSVIDYTVDFTDLVIPDTVEEGGFVYEVTSVGSSAFKGCSTLTSVTVGDSMLRIRTSAFSGCTNLESVDLGLSFYRIDDRAFKGCSLTEITLGPSLKTLSASAFDVTFEDGVGDEITAPKDLRGHTFAGTGGVLTLVA